MHGYGMQVVTTWQNPGNTPISKEDFYKLEREGLITRYRLFYTIRVANKLTAQSTSSPTKPSRLGCRGMRLR